MNKLIIFLVSTESVTPYEVKKKVITIKNVTWEKT
jgi:hypothetical protein